MHCGRVVDVQAGLELFDVDPEEGIVMLAGLTKPTVRPEKLRHAVHLYSPALLLARFT